MATEQTNADDAAAPLDQLLADAGAGPLRRWLPGRPGVDFIASLAVKPGRVGRRALTMLAELDRVALGRSAVEPKRGDRRFADPAWRDNPWLRRLVQAYLAAGDAVAGLVDDAGLSWRSDQRIRFLAENLVQATSPSNVPFVNPASAKAVIDTGGGSLVRGARAFARDMSSPPRVPRMVDPDALKPGRDLALTPGAVVLRSPVLELIQYRPQTERVRSVPLLIVPPTINKFYVTDLAPRRSLIEYLVRSGQQVFVISWRNPRAEDAAWGMDRYGEAIVDALGAIEKICETDRTLLLAACSGGIITSMLLGHLAARGGLDRIAGLGLLVTVLDQAKAGLPAAFVSKTTLGLAAASSARKGYLDGATLAELFAWLRPGDLIWNYWVNNYLLGQEPPVFDILSWNADTTRMSAALHRDFLTVAGTNQLVTPGAATMMGTPVDLSAVGVDNYVVAGVADHLCPWQNCYQSTQLLGGDSRFVLSTSGHIAAIVNPPGNPKASYRVGDEKLPDAGQWMQTSSAEQGSWWDDYVGWLTERGGPEKPSPAELGATGLAPLADAPGTYVFES
jgi:polyhydroxyalkanoate synthase subunit PhaC